MVGRMRDVFLKMELSGDAVEPYKFLEVFFGKFPQFAEQSQHGGYQQQDADECFMGILSIMDKVVQSKKRIEVNLIDDLFRFTIKYDYVNQEDPDDEVTTTYEEFRKLGCQIDNQENPVNTLAEGIAAGLTTQVEKFSEKNGRNCIYNKVGKISSLPTYLIVQKMRFIWKSDIVTHGNPMMGEQAQQGGKAKILRNVAFPKTLEMGDFCTEEIQEVIKPQQKMQNTKLENRSLKDTERFDEWKKTQPESENIQNLWKKFKAMVKEEDIKKHEKILWREDDSGLPLGEYEVVACITHKGRSSESGHYCSWVQKKDDEWYKFDDDYVTEHKLEDILALRGGGDHHMAYYLIYRKIELDKE